MKNEIINILIDEETDFISNYNHNMLNPQLSSYILEELRGKSLKKGLTIKINGNYFKTPEEKDKFLKLLRTEFSLSINDYAMNMKYSVYISLFLGILGIIFIIISNLINDVIFKEISLIIGWLGIWESTYNLIFNEGKNKIMLNRLKRILKAKIIFEEK